MWDNMPLKRTLSFSPFYWVKDSSSIYGLTFSEGATWRSVLFAISGNDINVNNHAPVSVNKLFISFYRWKILAWVLSQKCRHKPIKSFHVLLFFLVGLERKINLMQSCILNKQENGHSSMYTWILSTGWWKTRAPVNPDAVVVISFLCICLIGGFAYINRWVEDLLMNYH